MMLDTTITVVVQQGTNWVTLGATLAATLAAIAIAVFSARRDTRIRREDKREREKALAAAEETRALREAHKVVWTHENFAKGKSHITVINAGSGPILSVNVVTARAPGNDRIRWRSVNESGSSDTARVILPGRSFVFIGKWIDYHQEPYTEVPEDQRPEGALAELHWVDDAGRNWDTDNAEAQPQLLGEPTVAEESDTASSRAFRWRSSRHQGEQPPSRPARGRPPR